MTISTSSLMKANRGTMAFSCAKARPSEQPVSKSKILTWRWELQKSPTLRRQPTIQDSQTIDKQYTHDKRHTKERRCGRERECDRVGDHLEVTDVMGFFAMVEMTKPDLSVSSVQLLPSSRFRKTQDTEIRGASIKCTPPFMGYWDVK